MISLIIKGWAPTLVLKQRPGGTRKWPICLTLKWLWKQRTGIMNDETENWKLNKIDVWINCVRSRECRICRFRESNFQFFFPGEHAPEPPYIIRAFGADSTPALVSAVTLVLNVQLQKNSIPGQNEYWETVVQNLHNSGWKQKFEHQRNYTKQD